MSPPRRKLAILAVKCAVLALVLWGGKQTIVAAIDDLRRHDWQLDQLQLGWAFVAGLCYLASQFPSGWFWHGVLTSLGQRTGLPRALRAYYVGHLGKYVPGKAMVVVLRAGLVACPTVKTSLAVVAVFYETFTTMAVGAVLGAAIALAHGMEVWLILASLGLAIVVGLPTVPFVFIRLLKFTRLSDSTADLTINSRPAPQIHLGLGLSIRGWLTISIGWFLTGASLWATLRAIGVDNPLSSSALLVYTATVALSVVFGFVSMLPAGLGVRDVVLMQFLAPYLEQSVPHQGQVLALVAVIILRLIWLAAEAALAAILFPWGRKKSAKEV